MRMLRDTLLGFFCLLLPISSLSAADLLQVYTRAETEDAELRAAEARYRAALEIRPRARSLLLPQVSATADLGALAQDRESRARQDGTTASLGLNVEQNLYNAASRIGVTQAELTIEQAAANLDSAQQNLILRVAEAYFAVLVAQENLAFRQAEQEAISRQLEQTQRRFEVGLIAITDVQEARAQFDLSTAQVIAAENALNLTRESLAVFTNTYFGDLRGVDVLPDMPPPTPDNPQYWVDTGLAENPELQVQRLSTRIAQEEVARQRVADQATVGLNAGIKGTTTSGDLFANGGTGSDAQVGIRIVIPVSTGGRIAAQTREAQEQYEAARATLTLTERRTIQDIRSRYLSIIANASRALALAQALQSTRAAFESAQAGFEVGTRTQVDVLLALREVFRAERDYSEARYEYLLDTLRLHRAAGSLQRENLERLNALLQ